MLVIENIVGGLLIYLFTDLLSYLLTSFLTFRQTDVFTDLLSHLTP